MKTMVYVLAVVFLLTGVVGAFAADKPGPKDTPGQAKAGVNCCTNGKCAKADSADQCTKGGGKVVKDCAECK